MINVYAFATPNGIKVPMALEELSLPYQMIGVNVRKSEQSSPEYLAINPNGKVPAIIDQDGPGGSPVTIVESGAILMYLAEKYGKLLPVDPLEKIRSLEWLFFQVAGLGPMFGQAGYFLRSAPEKPQFALDRYRGEAARHMRVLDQHLAKHEWAAGQTYSIADIALFGWIWRREFAGVDFVGSPNVERWFNAADARPATQNAIRAVNSLVPPAT
jgi:GSH-dependent disulfide-bond oxidoreductase